MAKYLPRLNFQVHVLTSWNSSAPVFDPALLGQVPAEVRLHRAFVPDIPFHWRTRIWNWISGRGATSRPGETAAATRPAGNPSRLSELFRRILSPDPQVLWYPFALRRASRLIRQHGIDTVLITAPPYSPLLLGPALKRRFPHLVLVSDFRDEWLDWFLSAFSFHSSGIIRERARRIERDVVKQSDLVVNVTEASQDKMLDRYPDQPRAKFVCVPNGYDPDAFAGFQARRHASDTVRVTFLGTVYSTGSPRYYLDALETLPEPVRMRFETHFIGRVAGEEQQYLEGRTSRIVQHGFVPQKQAIQAMEETDYLLTTMTDPSSIPGKIYEYLATGKPILGFVVANGQLERFLNEIGNGWCADYTNPARGRQMLLDAAQAALANQTPGPDWERIRRYERPRLAAELARHIRLVRHTREA